MLKLLRRIIRGNDEYPQVTFTGARSGYYGGGLNAGGIRNTISGLGGSADKGDASFFMPDRIWARQELEIIYAQSWAAARFVDIPVDDQLIRWREFEEEDQDKIDEICEAESELMIREKLSRAMKAGRLFGTGALLIVTKEASLDTELMPENIFPDDLVGFHAFDRFDMFVVEWDEDHLSPTFGTPLMYRIQPKLGPAFEVHPSRLVRFDGVCPLSASGWDIYDRSWGVSELLRVIRSVMQDSALVGAITHLSQEASIPVIKTDGFKDAISAGATGGNLGADEISIEKHGEKINETKSIFRTLFLDKEDEFERISVQMGGYADLMDRFAKRIASAAGIPATRFLGSSPVGMNATGDGDMQNYALMIQAYQNSHLKPALDRIDAVLFPHLGMDEPLDYHFPSLIDLSDLDRADIGLKWSQALSGLLTAAAIDENEAREALTNVMEEFEELPEIEEDMLSKKHPDIDMMALEQTGEIEREKIEAGKENAKQKQQPPSKDKNG